LYLWRYIPVGCCIRHIRKAWNCFHQLSSSLLPWEQNGILWLHLSECLCYPISLPASAEICGVYEFGYLKRNWCWQRLVCSMCGAVCLNGKHLAVVLNTTKCSQIQWFLLKLVQ
jgi:hypothetical protein